MAEKASKSSKFSHKQEESISAVVSYLNQVSHGLKNRQLSFQQKDECVTFEIPEVVKLKIKANNEKKSGSVKFEISWKNEVSEIDASKNNNKISKSEKKPVKTTVRKKVQKKKPAPKQTLRAMKSKTKVSSPR